MKKVHLDTDIGGDMDDLCALIMLLKWPNIEITGVTTVAEEQGRRAGYVNYVLKLASRTDIPIKAGAVVNKQYRYKTLGYPPEEKNWPEKISPSPNPVDEALELLKSSIETGATIISIGPFTNLYLLDKKYPGILKKASLYLMGGYIYSIRKGFPQWENNMDWNIQVDVQSAKYVLENSTPTLIPLTITVETALKREYLPRIQQAGKIGQLIARQAEVTEEMYKNEEKYGLINFLHDPLAVAIALGWRDQVEIQQLLLKFQIIDTWLHEKIDQEGISTKVVTKINGERFNNTWLNLIVGQ